MKNLFGLDTGAIANWQDRVISLLGAIRDSVDGLAEANATTGDSSDEQVELFTTSSAAAPVECPVTARFEVAVIATSNIGGQVSVVIDNAIRWSFLAGNCQTVTLPLGSRGLSLRRGSQLSMNISGGGSVAIWLFGRTVQSEENGYGAGLSGRITSRFGASK